ncbi:hypothetical protein T01_7988 [Trichinella spiralis]|uniref:Uncharacterized protein n=1 Tax=Trichinella spiralis TaxID=6334 RepID=A0A0V1BFI6_TRISP|nr:hypothetical protein T01_7988 [Trichinella spiralis]
MTRLVTPNYVAGRPSSRPPRESVGCCVTKLLPQLVMTGLVTPNYVAGKPSSRPPLLNKFLESLNTMMIFSIKSTVYQFVPENQG